MTMEYTSLELQVISCEDLRAFNFFQKLSAYVTVSIVDDEPQRQQLHPALRQRHRTPTSKGGHRNPEWNHAVEFDLSAVSPRDYAGLSLRFDVRLPSVVVGSRSIGEVRASLLELVDDFIGPVQLRRYQVKNDDGKGIGVLNFRYKLSGKKSDEDDGNDLARVEPSPEAPVPGHNATSLEWPDLPPPALIRRILSSQTYSQSLSLQTTNKKDVNKASTGYGYRHSWYSMVRTTESSC